MIDCKFDSQELKGTTIVAIDDTPQNLSSLDDMLSDYGVEIIIATSGETGIERIKQSNPDLILLDIMLPGIDGFEIWSTFKSK